MTTFTYDAFRIGYDGGGIPNAFDIIQIRAVFDGDMTSLSYRIEADGSATLEPGVTSAANPNGFDLLFADGAESDDMFFTIAEQSWTTSTGQSGVLQGMYYLNPLTGVEYYIQLGGDPVPVATLQDVFTTGFMPVGSPRPIVGPLGPGQDVLPALTYNDPSFADLRVTENDLIEMTPTSNYIAFGGSGNDTFIGLDGQFDFVIYGELAGPVEIKLNKGWARKEGVGRDTLISIEDATGTDFGDKMIGDDFAGGNWFFGGDGADIMRGRGGNDLIEGNGDDDRIFGDDGDDELYGNAGEDRIDGGRGDDEILGGTERDVLRGQQDDDRLFGEDGDDRLVGGIGDDLLLGGADDDDLIGNSGEDTLLGGTGIDKLYGGQNADRLDGGADNDFLFGEGGADVFVFGDIEDMGRDRIKDWQDGIDRIDVSDFGFASFAELDALAFDISGGLRIQFANDSTGDARVVIIENFTKADFDASDVILIDDSGDTIL